MQVIAEVADDIVELVVKLLVLGVVVLVGLVTMELLVSVWYPVKLDVVVCDVETQGQTYSVSVTQTTACSAVAKRARLRTREVVWSFMLMGRLWKDTGLQYQAT